VALTGVANGQTASFNQKASGYVEKFIGPHYRYGGSSPSTGLDCSGLTQYVYKHLGRSIPRTAEAQYQHFKQGSNHMVSAASSSEGIRWQTIWSSDVTFGTITH